MYEYFYPGYKAGGPIQSLVNMVQALEQVYIFKIITSAYDLNSENTYEGVQLDTWNSMQLPGSNLSVNVWYDSTKKPSLKKMQSVILSCGADAVFINGFYTPQFLYPLVLKKMGRLKKQAIIVSPRGMLQAGALAIKPTQKKIYLALLKLLGLCRHISFHATTNDEATDIVKIFGNKPFVAIAGNVPKLPMENIADTIKKEHSLKLVYLSVITPKKNLLLLLQQVKDCKQQIGLHIYGPIKEDWYWKKCTDEMLNLPPNVLVEYKGDMPAHIVQQTLKQYDALVLLTKGENFGHALYESLSVGTPVLTSFFTPWNSLQEKNAGWNIDIEDNRTIATTIDELALTNNEQWNRFRHGALQVATAYYFGQSFVKDYSHLFNKSIELNYA